MDILAWIKKHPDFCTLLFYASLSVILTFPLVLNLTRAVPGHGADDPYLAWNIWWVKWSILDQGTNSLYSNYIFYPIGANLGTYTLTFLNGLISIPAQLVWDVIPADNLIVLFSITIAAFGAYLLVINMVGRESSAAVVGAISAGLIYGFGAYRFNYLYLGHFNFNSNEWLPFYGLYLERAFKERSPSAKSGAMAGLFLVFTGWTESTFAAFLAVLTALYLIFRLVFERARFLRRSVLRNQILIGLIGLVGLSPLLLSVGGDLARYGNFLSGGPNRADFLSADLISFVIPSQRNPLLGFLSRDLTYHNMDFAFVGYVTVLLALVGIVALYKRRDVAFWGIAALVFGMLMLGPVLHIANQSFTTVPLPYSLLQSIPLLGANRLPVRYDNLLMLAIAILAGNGFMVVLKRVPKPTLFSLLVPALILVEHLGIPLALSDLTAPPVYYSIAKDQGDFSILDLPLSWSSSTSIQGELFTQSQFYQTIHHKRLIGGNTSRPPPFEFQYFNELPLIHSLILLENGEPVDESTLERDIQASPDLVRFFDLRYLIIRLDLTGSSLMDYVRKVLTISQISNDGQVQAFRVESTPSTGLTIDNSQPVSRLYFDDRWGRAQTNEDGITYRWATAENARVLVPLSSVDYEFCANFAGAREGQSIRLSVNQIFLTDFVLKASWESHCADLPGQILHAGLNTIGFETTLTPLNLAALGQNRTIGKTGVIGPFDVAVTSGGFFAGKFASLTLGGREMYASKRGFYFFAVDPERLSSARQEVFDTFRDSSESARLGEFIRQLPTGTIVAGAVSDEASNSLTQEGVDALHSVGVGLDLRNRFRSSYAFVGVKGAFPGTALEQIDSTFPANVYIGANVTTPQIGFAMGTAHFTPKQK